jgi:hypothetical protein
MVTGRVVEAVPGDLPAGRLRIPFVERRTGMRKWILITAALVLIVMLPVTVMATGAKQVEPNAFSGSGDVTSQVFSGRDNSTSTSSKAWTDLNNMAVGPICALGAVTATVTVNVKGARAGFRVLSDHGATLKPGEGFVQGTNGGADGTMYSITFETNASTFEGSDGHEYAVQWRSTGGSTTLLTGSLVVQYGDPGTCV